MLPRHQEPIVAIATAPGRGAVGIVRASGRDLQALVDAVCGRALQPRHATYLALRDRQGEPIDQGLAIWFPAPHSYTGEAVLELHAHGGPVVLQLLLARCLEAGAHIGLRVAMPGEFTERAFLNGKLDLAQAEAVSDLIDASTEAAARSASRSLHGALSNEIRTLRDQLVALRTLVEATLDFPEEEITFLHQANALERLAGVTESIDNVLARARQGVLLREGIKVVIAGQPNVGKSSLLNALAGAELAIVTAIPGTTRDKVSETIQVKGVPVHVIDTAGLREDAHASDEVERIGIARAWSEIASADAVLFVHDLTRLGQPDYDTEEAHIVGRLPHAGGRLVHVYNKADVQSLVHAAATAGEGITLSARTGAGLDALRHKLLALAGWHAQPEGVFIARTRHVHALRCTRTHLVQAYEILTGRAPALELLAEELRLAHQNLGEITGQLSTEALLGEIFNRFCIGK
ncbi:MAG: tRNA uridine-5-carboxymethylaminomethyl(34) synthesis GTPase MnmE [Burkholderiaceae bacterium]|nr:tRNA uridine-5-carboxymethylaminomethyl(34) synthesis GTPase MnmE [Burkholderiaceae bacterium]